MNFFLVFFFTIRSMKGKLRREMTDYSEAGCKDVL